MTYMRICWKINPDALRKLMKKYARHKDVGQVGYNGLEIVVRTEKIVKDIKKYCRYRHKKLIIEEIEELELIKDDEQEDDLKVEFKGNLDNFDYKFADEWDEYLDDEWDEKQEEELLLRKKIDLTGNNFFSSLSYLMYIYDKNEPKPDIMDFYKYPDYLPACDCEDECDCEEQRMEEAITEKLILEGRYSPSRYSQKCLGMKKMMDKYY